MVYSEHPAGPPPVGASVTGPPGSPVSSSTPDPAWNEALTLLYDEAKGTIATWCREADRSARAILSDAEAARQQAHLDANRIREEARLEAGRILASAEAQAGQLRSQAQLAGAGRRAEVQVLRSRVEHLAVATDQLLDAMHGVLAALSRLAAPPQPGPVEPPGESDGEVVDEQTPGQEEVDVLQHGGSALQVQSS